MEAWIWKQPWFLNKLSNLDDELEFIVNEEGDGVNFLDVSIYAYIYLHVKISTLSSSLTINPNSLSKLLNLVKIHYYSSYAWEICEFVSMTKCFIYS